VCYVRSIMASVLGGGVVDPETLYTKQTCIGTHAPPTFHACPTTNIDRLGGGSFGKVYKG